MKGTAILALGSLISEEADLLRHPERAAAGADRDWRADVGRPALARAGADRAHGCHGAAAPAAASWRWCADPRLETSMTANANC